MATKQEVQIFDTLLDRGLSPEKAKEIIVRGRNDNTLEDISKNLWLKQIEDTPNIVEEKIPTAWGEWFIWPMRPKKEEYKAQIKEQELEEWLKWFISETWESLKQRNSNLWDIFKRSQLRVVPWMQAIAKAREEKGLWASFLESLKQTAFDLWTWVQWAWQIVATGWDIAWEWLENLIQEFTPEQAEKIIEGAISNIGDSKAIQSIAKFYREFREKNPETARNIEWVVNISQVSPLTKAWQALKKPVSEASQKAVREAAEKQLRNQGRAVLNLGWKMKTKDQLDISKFFADKVKITDDFDNLVTQFEKIWKESIKKVDSSLAKSKTLHKPQWAKEVLKVMIDNAKDIEWNTKKIWELKWLMKKWSNEWLTLSELNKIKRSINDYTKWWTKSWKEWWPIKAATAREKYREVMQYIENTASRENLWDIRNLNKDWIDSTNIMWNLNSQATRVWKKQWMQSLQKQNLIKSIWTRIRQAREDAWFSDMIWSVWLEDLDLKKVLKTIKDTAKKTEAKTIQSKIQGKLDWMRNK